MEAILVEENLDGFAGEANLYKLDKTIVISDYDDTETKFEYVIVSKVEIPFPVEKVDFDIETKETYIFPASEDGDVINWTELPGSLKGDISHDYVLEKFLDYYKDE